MKPKFRVVNTDNFGGDYPDETFVGGFYDTFVEAAAEAVKLNGNHPYASRYFKVVSDDYKLKPGFQP